MPLTPATPTFSAHCVRVVAGLFERLAAGYSAFEGAGIAQGVPDLFAGSIQRVTTGDIHRSSSLRSSVYSDSVKVERMCFWRRSGRRHGGRYAKCSTNTPTLPCGARHGLIAPIVIPGETED